MRDMIEDLALIAHPRPRQGEVQPPEAFGDAAEQIALDREDYEQNLRAFHDGTDEDPLLAELGHVAGRRDAAEIQIRTLLAYGRHFTGGTRPGYSWPVLAEAAGLDRKTAERRVSEADIAAVRRAVEAGPLHAQQATGRRRGMVTFELHADEDLHFVLTDALRDFASRQHEHAKHDDETSADHTRWAELAENAVERIEAAI